MVGDLVLNTGVTAGASGGFGQFGGAAVASGTGAAAAFAAAIPGATAAGSSSTIDSYYLSRHCAVCDALTRVDQPLCATCAQHPQMAMAVLAARTARLERQHQQLVRLCLHCGGGGGFVGGLHGGVVCDSLDCGVYYERKKAFKELRVMSALAAVAGSLILPGDQQ
jgi:DNA polymerase zeta